MSKHSFISLCSLIALLYSVPALSQCSAQSASTVTPLLSLYTSEGCSSCPPADKWISKINASNAQVTPLAFHVDYWDYIGWKDRFAKPEYAQRQRKVAALGGSSFVYTPQFILNGSDYRHWSRSSLSDQTKELRQPAEAKLTLHLEQHAKKWKLHAAGNAMQSLNAKNMTVFVALYENDLESQVNAGENAGRKLKHDYVVRKMFGGYTLDSQHQFKKTFKLGSNWNQKNAGAVVFMQDEKTGKIIQSLALPFCDG